jgi:hypothetical protein
VAADSRAAPSPTPPSPPTAGPDTLRPPPGDPDASVSPDTSPDAEIKPPRLMELAVGLVLWLPFDDPRGSAAARDDSSGRNRVSLQGLNPMTAWVPGRLGGALDLAAAASGTGHLRVENSPSVNLIGEEVSISVWLFRPQAKAGVILSRRATVGGGSLYRLELTEDDRLRLVLNDRPGLPLQLQSGVKLPREAWVHVAIACDKLEARLYVDGKRAAMALYGVPIANDVTPVIIGASEGDPSGGLNGFFSGRLDELLVYQRVLTEPEITALAGGALPPAP